MTVKSPQILFSNAHIVDPASGHDAIGDVLVEKRRIAHCGGTVPDRLLSRTVERVDCSGLHIFPGLIDGRVFVGEPGAEHRETIVSAGQAAAAGGITSVVMMPDTNPVIDDVALVQFIRQTAKNARSVNFYPAAAVTRELEALEMTEIGLLQDAGAVAFTQGRQSLDNALLIRRIFTYARDFGAVVMAATEDRELAASGVMNEGLVATRLGLPGIPAEAEIIPLERDIRLARLTGCRYHASTISTAESARLIASAKASGCTVTSGISITNLSLNENDIGPYRTFFRISPPLRSEDDRRAMVEALRDGTIDIIVSNHDPQDVDTKRHPFADAANGAIGLETLLAAALRLVHNGEVSLLRLIETMTSAPARLFGLPGGTLANGAPADLIVVDIGEPWIVHEDDIVSRSKNTPFEGARFQGRVLQTWVGGRKVFNR